MRTTKNILIDLIFKAAAVFMVVALMTSCITEKKRQKICASCSVKEVTKDSIIYKTKDSLIYITGIETEILYLPNPCALLCDSALNLKPLDTVIKVNKTDFKIKSFGNWLTFQSKIDSLKKVISYLETTKQKEVVKVIEKSCLNERKPIDGFYKYTSWFFIILFLIHLSIYYLKNKLK